MHNSVNFVEYFFKKYKWYGIPRLIFYPLTNLISAPVRLLQALWSCRRLSDGKWEYLTFSAYIYFQYLFYYTDAWSLYHYGRNGTSQYIGLGDFELSRFFHYPFLSLMTYWRLAPIAPLISLLLWWANHFIWLPQTSVNWFFIIMALAVFSTFFSYNAFGGQNYNALGWIFFPLGLFALIHQQYWLAALAWTGTALTSITVLFFGGIYTLLFLFLDKNPFLLFTLVPAVFCLVPQVKPLFSKGNFFSSLLSTLKGIGVSRRNVKFKRTLSRSINLQFLYFVLFYGLFIAASIYFTSQFSLLILMGFGIFVINSVWLRFADEESIQMLILSVFTAYMLLTPELRLLPFYWLAISPLPMVIFGLKSGYLEIMPKYELFSIEKIYRAMEDFLKQVPRQRRILMAFEDPKGIYENICDGYRRLIDLPLHIATRNDIHLLPNWWAVIESNYEGSPDFWGRDVLSVKKNCQFWKADYVIVYQELGLPLASEWEQEGFKVLSQFSWSGYDQEIHGEVLSWRPLPDWWLLSVPAGDD